MPDQRTYTIQAANELLPWLTEIFKQLEEPREFLIVSEKRLVELDYVVRNNGQSDVDKQIRQCEDTVLQLRGRINELATEVAEKKIEIRDLRTGLVDFPGVRENRRIWLCWRVGEPEVGYWHELDAGFSSRQAI